MEVDEAQQVTAAIVHTNSIDKLESAVLLFTSQLHGLSFANTNASTFTNRGCELDYFLSHSVWRITQLNPTESN
jgi:hypothetical protein